MTPYFTSETQNTIIQYRSCLCYLQGLQIEELLFFVFYSKAREYISLLTLYLWHFKLFRCQIAEEKIETYEAVNNAVHEIT